MTRYGRLKVLIRAALRPTGSFSEKPMYIRPWVLCLVLSGLPSSAGDLPVVWFERDGLARSAERQAYVLALIDDLNLKPLLTTGQLRGLRQEPTRRIAVDDPNFGIVTGIAAYLDDRGVLRRFRVWTVPNRQVFQRFVDAEAAQRGADALVTGADRVTIGAQVLSGTPQDGVLRTREIFISYVDGLIALGDHESVHDVRFEPLREWTRAAGEKHEFGVLRLRSIPRERIEFFVESIRQGAQADLQRRDDEGRISYLLRRTAAEEYIDLLTRITADVDEISWWTQWPKDADDDFVLEGRLDARPGTTLAAQITRLPRRQLHSGAVAGLHDEALAEMTLAVSLPPQWRPFARVLCDKYIRSDGLAIRLCRQVIQRGFVEVTAALTGSKQPRLQLAMPSPGFRVDPADSLLPFSGTPGRFVLPFERIPALSRLADYSAVVTQTDQTLGLEITRLPAPSEQSAPSATPRMSESAARQRLTAGRLLSVTLDLLPLRQATASDERLRLVREVERAFDQWMLTRVRNRIRFPSHIGPDQRRELLRMSGIPETLPGGFTSLADRFAADSRLTLEAQVTVVGSSLKARVNISDALHRLYRARGLIAGARMFPDR